MTLSRPVLSRDEFNHVLLVATACALVGAFLAGIFLIFADKFKCKRHSSEHPPANAPKPAPPVSVTKSPTDKDTVTIKIGDEIDYIDDRSSGLVSSTVQISSIHNSTNPPPAPV